VTATVNGVAIAYSDTGSGVPLLCVHGGMGIDGASLRVPGVLRLADRGVRVIIPDQRGHGASDRGAPSLYNHRTWVDDIHALASHLGLMRTALLGHSYGGFLALEFALQWPDALTHLVLVGTSAGPVNAPATEVRSNDDLRERFRTAWPMFFAGSDKHWPLFEALAFSAAPYNAAFTRELPRYDLRARAGEIHTPALLIVGAADWYRPHMESLARLLPNARLHVIGGASHFPFVEAEGEFLNVVGEFLDS
jgi:proline iminopeptidase